MEGLSYQRRRVYVGAEAVRGTGRTCTGRTCTGRAATNPARALAESVTAAAQDVSIDFRRLTVCAESLAYSEKLVSSDWKFPPYPTQSLSVDDWATYSLYLNCQNACFFHLDGTKALLDRRFSAHASDGRRLEGAELLAHRITEHFDFLRDPRRVLGADSGKLAEQIFGVDPRRGEVDAPFVGWRVQAIKHVANYLHHCNEHGIRFGDVIRHLNGDALKLVEYLTALVPFSSDPFRKLPQLAVQMMGQRLRGSEEDPFDQASFELLTVPADYRLPQALYALGILEFSPPLLHTVASRIIIPTGSTGELEIRGATIVAADTLKEEIGRVRGDRAVGIFELDYLLWKLGRTIQRSPDQVPPDLGLKRERIIDHPAVPTMHF